jgi:hypothetical protein
MLASFAKRFFKKNVIALFLIGGSPFAEARKGDGIPPIQGVFRMPERRYRLDHARGRLVLGGLEIPVPRSRTGRIVTGTALVGGGILGFLPILGFWMVPLGFIVLSHDIPAVRRRRRRLSVWWIRRKNKSDQKPRP